MLGFILAGITVIVSGLAYLFAGSNPPKVKSAKDILKAGIIGAFIIFGAGVIVGTIKGFAEDPFKFFGGGGGGPQAYGCPCIGGFLTCAPQVGGTYDNPTCSGSCPGTFPC